MFHGWRPTVTLANTVEDVRWWKASIRCDGSEALAKAGGMNECILGERVLECCRVRVCWAKAGKVPRTCVSHLEGSL